MSEPHPVPRRPGTVTAAGVILYALAVLGLAEGLIYFSALGSSNPDFQAHHGALATVGTLEVTISLLEIVLGLNVWRGRRWARTATIVLLSIDIAISILGLFAGGGGDAIISVVLAALIIWLLAANRPAREFFAR